MSSSLAKLQKAFGAQDMTQGEPWKNLVKFSVPLLIGNFAQQLYSTVDSIVVGQYVGDNALAAVGASGPIMNLLLVLLMGISTGAGIMVSQFYGAHDRENLSKTVGNCLTLTAISAIVIMIVGLLTTYPILTALQTPAEIIEDTHTYLVIMYYGMLGMAFYNIVSGILRGLGDSVSPLLYLLVACGLNIALDLWFVIGFGWGVSGVAWATIIAQFVSSVLCLVQLCRMRSTVDINRRTLRLHASIALRIGKLGLPAGITQAIFSMAMIMVQSLTNSFGAFVITCSTVVMRVDGFAMMPNFTFGMAMTTFAGQNVGARRLDRVHTGTREGLKLGLIVSTTCTAAIMIFGRYLFGLFTNTPAVIDTSMHMMSIIAVGYIAFSVSQVLSGVMRGAGDTMTPMWISLFTTVVLRVPIAYGWAYLTRSAELPNGSPDSLYFSLLISWVMTTVITAIFFKRGRWRKKAQEFFGAEVKETESAAG